jgi:uncharacterized protein YcnI
MRPPPSGAPLARPSLVPQTGHVPTEKELEPLTLIEDDTPATVTAHAPAAAPPKKIQAFGADAHVRKQDWKRALQKTGNGATRVRSFHGKYSEQGLEYLDNAINEWLDTHPDVEVKFVTSTVMTFEGKIREPALVLNVWY